MINVREALCLPSLRLVMVSESELRNVNCLGANRTTQNAASRPGTETEEQLDVAFSLGGPFKKRMSYIIAASVWNERRLPPKKEGAATNRLRHASALRHA
jgi:hypothetical protein